MCYLRMYIDHLLVLLQVTECKHFKSTGDPHPQCDICMNVSQGRFCKICDLCELCVDLDKSTWRRIMDTRRKRDARVCQQNLQFREITATPLDPSDSGFQGNPPSSKSAAKSLSRADTIPTPPFTASPRRS